MIPRAVLKAKKVDKSTDWTHLQNMEMSNVCPLVSMVMIYIYIYGIYDLYIPSIYITYNMVYNMVNNLVYNYIYIW